MLKGDLKKAGIPVDVNDEAAIFHSLRHTFSSMLARSAPVKVTQELSRHSTPTLTIGTYSHATMKERAAAVAALPLPGSANGAVGPFGGLTRAELEHVAESLLVCLLTRPLTLERQPNRDSGGRSETLRANRAAVR